MTDPLTSHLKSHWKPNIQFIKPQALGKWGSFALLLFQQKQGWAEQTSPLLVCRLLPCWQTTPARWLEKSQQLVTNTANMSKIHEKECLKKVIQFSINHFTWEIYSVHINVLSPNTELNKVFLAWVYAKNALFMHKASCFTEHLLQKVSLNFIPYT